VPSAATAPASVDAADVTAVRFETVRKGRAVTGFRVTVTLAAPPADGVFYRVKGATKDCAGLWLEYARFAGGGTQSGLHKTCQAKSSAGPLTAAVVKSSIVLTVAAKDVPAGTVIDRISVSTGGAVGAAATPAFLAPQLDYASTKAAFRVGD
jgi:hypothetical protein